MKSFPKPNCIKLKMSIIQRTEKIVSSNAKIVKRGDQYVLVDMSIVFPEEIWSHIKSYIPQSPHPYIQYKKIIADTQETPSFRFVLETKWTKKDVVRVMGMLIDNINNEYNENKRRRNDFTHILDPENKAYKNITKTQFINLFIWELKYTMRKCLCVLKHTATHSHWETQPNGDLQWVERKPIWLPLKVSKIPPDKIAVAQQIFQFVKNTKKGTPPPTIFVV